MQQLQRFLTFFKINPGEERLVGRLFLLALMLELAFVFIKSMAFGVFLAEYGPQSLPYSYIFVAIFASLTAVLYIKLSERVSFPRMLILNLAFLTTFSLLMWWGLNTSLSFYVAFTLPLLYEIVTNLGYLALWQLAGRLFDFQQTKRLFPLLIAGIWFADILGGLLVQPLVGWMAPIHLILPAIAFFGLSMLNLRAILLNYLKKEGALPPSRHTAGAASTRKRPASFLQNRYVLLILAFVLIWWVAFYFLDNIFADRVAAQFPDANQLTAFMGRLLSITGIVAFLSSTILTSRIISRFGIRAGLLGEAASVAVILGLLAIIGSLNGPVAVVFVLASLAKLVNTALGFSLSQTAYTLLYQALPDSIRTRAQAIADGIGQPIASGIAGISLLALMSGLKFDYLRLTYVYLGLATGLLIIIVLLSKDYVRALTQAITKRRLGEIPIALADPASIALLRNRLHDPHPGAAIYALTKLEDLDEQIVISELPALIQHPAPEVRREAFLRIEKLRPGSIANAVRNQLAVENVSWVKEAALRALGGLTKGDPISPLTSALDEMDVPALRGALVGLLKHANHAAAKQKLDGLLASPSSEDQILAIQVLGEINRREYYPHLISACDSRHTSQAAGLALASIGTDAGAEIEMAFTEPAAPRQRLFILAKTLGHIDGAHSHRILLTQLSTPDEELRSQILNALSQSNYRTKDVSAIQRAVKVEVEQAAWYCAAQVELSQTNRTTLLVGALEEYLRQIRDRVLLLLSCVFDRDSIRRAREAFSFGSATQVSYALEIMDTQLPSEWKGWIMPLLEELPPLERCQRFAEFFPQAKQTSEEHLCAILEKDGLSFWVRACAAYAYANLFPGAQKGNPAMISTVEKVLILKTVSMFGQTPDQVLADAADLLEEIEVSKGETIFKKGDPGDSMYIIVDGKVRVHTEERLLNNLGESDVFGEMALLDPEPRLASVTAVEPTRLFRLDQSPFYQLMAERPEVATGIIRVLTRLLRDRVRDLTELDSRIKELEELRTSL